MSMTATSGWRDGRPRRARGTVSSTSCTSWLSSSSLRRSSFAVHQRCPRQARLGDHLAVVRVGPWRLYLRGRRGAVNRTVKATASTGAFAARAPSRSRRASPPAASPASVRSPHLLGPSAHSSPWTNRSKIRAGALDSCHWCRRSDHCIVTLAQDGHHDAAALPVCNFTASVIRLSMTWPSGSRQRSPTRARSRSGLCAPRTFRLDLSTAQPRQAIFHQIDCFGDRMILPVITRPTSRGSFMGSRRRDLSRDGLAEVPRRSSPAASRFKTAMAEPMAASGFRNSSPSIARNSSFVRLLASASWRAVRSC